MRGGWKGGRTLCAWAPLVQDDDGTDWLLENEWGRGFEGGREEAGMVGCLKVSRCASGQKRLCSPLSRAVQLGRRYASDAAAANEGETISGTHLASKFGC